MRIKADDAVPELNIPPRRGRRSYVAFHAAGHWLLVWWRGQGRDVTANLGRGEAKAGGRQPLPSAAVRFLAAELLSIARCYKLQTELTEGRALDVAFKVAQAHVRRRRTAFR